MTTESKAKIQIGGIPITALGSRAILAAGPFSLSSGLQAFSFVNAATVATAQRDQNYSNLLRESGTNLPDGRPLVFILRLCGVPEAEQARGPTVFAGALKSWNSTEHRHFLLGATPKTLEAIVAKLARENKKTNVVGLFSPPLRELEDTNIEDMVTHINASGANIIWLGLGSPKQDYVAREISSRTHLPVFAVGAAFDFYAGVKPEAPAFLQSMGLEWLFRLSTEPKRLWKRYLMGNSIFLLAVLRRLRDDRLP